jgi:hypothetical protein
MTYKVTVRRPKHGVYPCGEKACRIRSVSSGPKMYVEFTTARELSDVMAVTRYHELGRDEAGEPLEVARRADTHHIHSEPWPALSMPYQLVSSNMTHGYRESVKCRIDHDRAFHIRIGCGCVPLYLILSTYITCFPATHWHTMWYYIDQVLYLHT